VALKPSAADLPRKAECRRLDEGRAATQAVGRAVTMSSDGGGAALMASGLSVTIRSLSRRFDDASPSRPALEGVNLAIAGGEFVVILGPSGSGKSTLLRCIAGVDDYSGQILIGGEDRSRLEAAAIRCEWVPQQADETFLPQSSLARNMMLGARLRGEAAPTGREIREVAESFGIEMLLDRRPREVSGGEMQRAALCRALLGRPDLLLLDEPLSGIDEQHRATIRQLILKGHRASGATSICVSHDAKDAHWLADRCVIMNQGRIEQVGTPREIVDEPETEFVLRFFDAPEVNELWVVPDEQGLRLSEVESPGAKRSLIRARDLVAVATGSAAPSLSDVFLARLTCLSQRWLGDHFQVTAAGAAGAAPLVASSTEQVGSEVDVYARRRSLFFFGGDGRRRAVPS